MRVKADVQNTTLLIASAQAGDLEAYDQLVLQFQDRAVAYGYSVLADWHQAEDAAQEAFVEAFYCLRSLQDPTAFSAWFRRIVFKHCDRIMRKRQQPTVALDVEHESVADLRTPVEMMEQKEFVAQVRVALEGLVEHERVVVLLFYMGEHSQPQIAEFLGLPLSTVKKRLYTARQKLKEKLLTMLQDNLEHQRPSKNRRFVDQVANNVTQSLAEMAAGDVREHEIRRHHPEARYRDPHPIFELVVSLLTWACERNASEITLLPGASSLEIQFVIEGARVSATTIPGLLQAAVISRLKDMTNVERETSQPQSGSFPMHWSSQNRDFRVDVTFSPPTQSESVVLRLCAQ